MGVANRCQTARAVRRPPRPVTLPWNVLVVHSDPPAVDDDDVEEFLVHDPLFVEFFNAFLSLPSFPEPICFNVETGGFEVVSDAKRHLAQQIKEAVRSQNLTAKMYRVVRNHAFSNIPLIPIEDTQSGPEAVKIDTSFEVTALNKDQGIYWIKAERLPIFLESDYYFQYRLAKVISQARIFNDKGEFIIMKIDFTRRPKKKKVSVEVPPPNLEETIMKEMFVSFGDVRGAAKEDWFNLAKAELRAEPPFTPIGVKTATTSQITGMPLPRGTSSKVLAESRPPTAETIKSERQSSVFHSHFFGVYAPGILGPSDVDPPIMNHVAVKRHMQNTAPKPFTPRPNERMFSSTDMVRKKVHTEASSEEYMAQPGAPVYHLPKQELYSTDTESGIGDMEEKEEDFEKRMNEQPIIDQIYNDGSWEGEGANIPLRNIDDLGSVIVGAIMKKTVASMLEIEEIKVAKDPAIANIYPSPDLTCVSVSDLDLCVVMPGTLPHYMNPDPRSNKHSAADSTDIFDPTRSKTEASDKPKTSVTDNKSVDLTPKALSISKSNSQMLQPPTSDEGASGVDSVAGVVKEPIHIKWDKEMKKPAEEESDADSLLDSDEDFEERDSHFRRNRTKWHSLSSLKGIMAFKDFLKGTSGEKYWSLWIDIDKGHLIHSEDDKQRYIMYMRNTYFRKGAIHELSLEDKKKLGLENISSWCPEHLSEIHPKVLEPLVLYWAPRYLLRHLMRAHPEKYKEYNEMKACQPQQETDPFPQTTPLLPLRPKSCCPRTSTGQGFEPTPRSLKAFTPKPPSHGTSPMVGNYRVYGEDTIRRLADTPSGYYLGLRPTTAGPKPPSRGGAPPSASRQGRRPSTHTGISMTTVEPPHEGGGASPTTPSAGKASVKGSPRTHDGLRTSTQNQYDDIFVGKVPGVSNEHTHSDKRLVSEKSSSSVQSKKQQKKSCLTRNLDHILDADNKSTDKQAHPALGVVKKPKDLLSPMLKIVDTDSRSKRVRSAPAPEMTKGVNTNTFYRQDSQSSSRKCPADIMSTASESIPDNLEGLDETSHQVVSITDCDFMGSTRMEFLLQALHHENDAGRSLRKYIEKSGREDWANNLDFWEKVQQYRKLFYKDKLDLFLISWQAKAICAQCIVEGAEKHIGVGESVELAVLERLSPAYECLFDEAEEHALKKLFEAFQLYLSQDVKTYCKVERSALTRRLETKNTYILNLQKKGIIKEGPLTPDDPMAGYVDPVCDESLLEKIPERFREWSLDKLMHNRIELEHFRLFLAENYAEVDLKCWVDIETWRRTPHEEDKKRDQRARDIKKNYLNKRYFFGPSSPAGKEGQNKVMEVGGGWGKFLEDKPHSRSILEAQKYVRERLEKKHLPMFLASAEFQARQSPKLSVSDSADDVVTQKRKRTAAVLKLLESRWVTSAKEINCFRQSLKNPLTCDLFRQFVSLHGDNLENDVLFWLEVQKYKDMHHSHNEDVMLNQKIGAIVNCFIDSSIPPNLQIDIPQDMADRILEHKHERGPYLFREAQLATFRILLQYWQPFVEFRNNMVSTDRATKTLERHRILARRKEQEFRDAQEAQRERDASPSDKRRNSLEQWYQERLQKLEEELAAAEAGEDDERGSKVGFSYSQYLLETMERCKDTQTPRSEEEEELPDIPGLYGKRRESGKPGKDKGGNSGGSQQSELVGAGQDSIEGTPSNRKLSSPEGKRRASQVSGKKEEQYEDMNKKKTTPTERPLSGKKNKPTANGPTHKPKKTRPNPPVVIVEEAE